MTMEILVLGVDEIDFENKEKSESVQGVRVNYGLTNDGKPRSKGYSLMSAFLKGSGAKELVKSVPGVYEGEFDVRMNSKLGKADLKLFNLTFKHAVNIVPMKAG